jgi:MurNAc alpha-1-phosphate uridylyltransferase
MVLAAGLGQRMRPITATLPKPLIKVGGRALIDYSLDRLADAGITRAVVNVHHLADQVEAHVAARRAPAIVISDERSLLLETGGGLKKARPLLGEEPFLTLNSDSLWVEGSRTSLGYEGRGDFAMDPHGRLRRRREREVTPFVFAGVSIVKPKLLDNAPDGPFSANLLYDRAIEAERLFGLRLDGEWLHVGDPPSIAAAEERLAASVR